MRFTVTTRPAPKSPLAQRVAVYAHALTDDRTRNAFGVTSAEVAGYLYDRLDANSRSIAHRVLDGAGVSL